MVKRVALITGGMGGLGETISTKMADAGYRVVNVDATIIAQEPRMAPHVAGMIANIAADLGVEDGAVNVKAKCFKARNLL